MTSARPLRRKNKKHAQNPLRQENGQVDRKVKPSKGKLRPLITQRRKSRESANTTRPATSAKMGKPGKDSTSWNGARNSADAFAQKKEYMFRNAGNTCYLGSSLQLLLITGLDIPQGTEYRKIVKSPLTDVTMYDNSNWIVYGVGKLQDPSERGARQDSAEFIRKLIDALCLSALEYNKVGIYLAATQTPGASRSTQKSHISCF